MAAAGSWVGEMSKRSKEELAREQLICLQGRSEEEGSGDEGGEDRRSPEGVEGMELDGEGKVKDKGEVGGEVFLTPEEMLQAELREGGGKAEAATGQVEAKAG